MHDELRRYALRQTGLLTLALVAAGGAIGVVLVSVAAFTPGWPPSGAWVAGGWRPVLAGGLLGATGTSVLVLLGHHRGARRAWPTVPLIPAPDLVPLAEGLAIARGEPVPRVWRLDSAAPNVACLSWHGERHLVVSTAAEAGLARNELEAVMALQFSLLVDRGADRVRRLLVAASLMINGVLWLSGLATIVVVVRRIFLAGLTINVAVWATIGLVLVVVACQRRIRWSWGMVGDAVAVETTRHPAPLVRALRRLAGHNDGVVPVRQTWGATDPWWAITVRSNVTMQNRVVNGRAHSRSSTEQVSDAALLLRARIVELACLRHEVATVASWRDAQATFARLARASGDRDDAADGTVDGVAVTVDGAVGTLPPVNGSWPPAFRDAAARHRLRTARPVHPDAAALAAYDRAVASGLRPF